MRKRELAAGFNCIPDVSIVTINVLWLSLTVPLVSLQRVIAVFPDHTYFQGMGPI